MTVKTVGTGLSLPGALCSLNTTVLSSVDQIPLLVSSPQWLSTPSLHDLNSFSISYRLSISVSLSPKSWKRDSDSWHKSDYG